MDCTEKKLMICNHLKKNHIGRGEAVHSRELERLFSLNGRTLRTIIHTLRQEGHPICSSSRGYYYAGNQEEVQRAAARLGALASKIASAQDAPMNSSISQGKE